MASASASPHAGPPAGRRSCVPSARETKALRTWFGGHGSDGLVVGLDDLCDLLQP